MYPNDRKAFTIADKREIFNSVKFEYNSDQMNKLALLLGRSPSSIVHEREEYTKLKVVPLTGSKDEILTKDDTSHTKNQEPDQFSTPIKSKKKTSSFEVGSLTTCKKALSDIEKEEERLASLQFEKEWKTLHDDTITTLKNGLNAIIEKHPKLGPFTSNYAKTRMLIAINKSILQSCEEWIHAYDENDLH